MLARGDRVTVRSHAGQEVKATVVGMVNDSGAYVVRTSSGRRVVSSAQMTARVSEGGIRPRDTDKIRS